MQPETVKGLAPNVGLNPGDVIAEKWQIVRMIGHGGMGAVFEAKHTLINKTVAIKVLHPDVAQNEQMADRFSREARFAELKHPNIVEIHDYGRDRGRPFMVMEYLHGESLADLMARVKPMTPAQ